MQVLNNPRPLAVTVTVACQISGVGRTTLYQLVKDGKIRLAKVGSRTLVNYDDLERVVASQFASPAEPEQLQKARRKKIEAASADTSAVK